MLFTVRLSALVLVLMLASCASVGGVGVVSAERCGTESAPAALPLWLDKTAFELALPDDYHYGKGEGATYEAAVVAAQGDIALQVSASIFSRTVLEQTESAQRAAAVSQAIADLQGSGIEPIGEWRSESCAYHIFSRVSKAEAAQWKTAAQSFLVFRPGLGRVRRDPREINAQLYQERGSPLVFIGWRSGIQGARPLQLSGTQGEKSLLESHVRLVLGQNGIALAGGLTNAALILELSLIDGVLEGVLYDRQRSLLAKVAKSADSSEKTAIALIEGILAGWLHAIK